MQEFLAVSVSSYEADSLAPKLTEQSAAGWSVVAIVSAGSSVTAYLSRPAEASEMASEPEASDVGVIVAGGESPEPEPMMEPEPEPAVEPEPEPAMEPAIEPVVAAAATVSLADQVADLVPQLGDEPTMEPAGWAASDTPASTVPEVSVEPALPTTAAPAPAPEPEPEPEPQPAAAAAAPGGWYADPSGRFELRYWDGTQWTEHVSRAGQQFTDPPVA